MRFIEDLRNTHKGEIWIIGCGPSLDDLPDDFFDDKISIAVNWSFVAFPSATYFLWNHNEGPNLMSLVRPDLLKKCILSLTPQRWGDITWYEDYNEDPIYAKWESWCKVENKEAFQVMADKIMKGESSPLISLKTTVHNAISAAVILGAKKVTLVGCETVASKYKMNAQGRGMWFFYKEPQLSPEEMPRGEYPIEWQKKGYPSETWSGERHRLGTKFLAEVFKPYGIEIMRFYYKKGYEKIIE